MTAVLDVRELRTLFNTDDGEFAAVDGVSFSVEAGRTLAIVGESGCGKSVTALSIMGLVPSPPGRIASGSIRFEGTELVGAPESQLQDLRGNGIAMIFQEPMSSLNPVFTIGEQIVEGLLRHLKISRAEATLRAIAMLTKVRIPAPEQREGGHALAAARFADDAQIGESLRLHAGLDANAARARSIEMLHQVGIPAPEKRVDEYPHQMSGGMRQRVMIAMALACRPDILIADEPTTALDVTVQAQIFDLLRDLQREKGTAILLITHDMGAVAEMADRVMVMYAGRVIEQGTAAQVLGQPGHPYTQGLIDCLPELGSSASAKTDSDRVELAEITGVVPSIWELGSGCAFRERCPHAMARCESEAPPLFGLDGDGGHGAACWLHAEDRRVVA